MDLYSMVVIGGGAGGLTVAAGAASMGVKVALIEKKEFLGGDCLHYGCIPSKALIEATKEIYTARKAAINYQLDLSGKIDLSLVMSRIKQAIAEIQKHDSHERFEQLGVDVYYGTAQFMDDHHIQLDDGRVIAGKRIVIATGSSPYIPPILGLEEVDYLTNETIFHLQSIPEKMAVIGAGPIGLELAQSFARIGSEVTVIESGPEIMQREDEHIRSVLQQCLAQELMICLNTKVIKVEQINNRKLITLLQNGSTKQLSVDSILVATGRRPNISSLRLDRAGVKVEKG